MSNFMCSNASNRSIGDRFIPNRLNSNIDLAHFKLFEDKHKKTKVDIFSLKPNKQNIYKELLQSTLNFNDFPIFSYNTKLDNTQKKDKNPVYNESYLWPCTPRKYPVLYKPDIVLDWPNDQTEVFWNIVDWGSNGYMATIWSNKVYLWHNTEKQQEEVITTKIKAFGALKWNHDSTKLAVAGRQGDITIWSFAEKKVLDYWRCYCTTCSFSCLAWDVTDSIIVGGCTRGVLMLCISGIKPLRCVHAHDGRVVSMAFCSANKYLCSSGTDGKVRIWIWPECQPHVEISCCSPIRAIAFHPWKPSLLAVGGGVGDGSLSLWNVNTASKISYLQPDNDSFVDCLAWNKLTGEMVSSHQLFVSETRPPEGDDSLTADTKVLVLAGLDRVVDSIDGQFGRMLYLMWDKTGTKLATACSDESLCIWNFLGNKSKSCQAVFNKNKTLGSSKRSVLSSFEKCIR